VVIATSSFWFIQKSLMGIMSVKRRETLEEEAVKGKGRKHGEILALLNRPKTHGGTESGKSGVHDQILRKRS